MLAFDVFENVREQEESYPDLRETVLLPGASNFVQNLIHKEVKCALISNDNSKGIHNFLSQNSLNEKFSFIFFH